MRKKGKYLNYTLWPCHKCPGTAGSLSRPDSIVVLIGTSCEQGFSSKNLMAGPENEEVFN